MSKIRISAVSYLNSLPFVYGLKHSPLANDCDISLDTPSVCADKLISGKVDIGLIPIAAIQQVPHAKIISDYCIGSNGEVRTVCLYSEVPLDKIKTILLDYQSRTSVLLAKILVHEYWKINPEFVDAKKGFEKKIKGTTAGVVIGDRTFYSIPGSLYKLIAIYDLSNQWKNFTGLPFVFACWVTNKKLPATFVSEFNNALENGLNNIDKTLKEFPPSVISKAAAKKYLTENINYDFDTEKKKAMKLFNKLSQKIILQS